MMFAVVTLHQLRYVLLEAGHTSVYAATLADRAAPAVAAWTRILKSPMKISNGNFQWNFTTILERSIALCWPNSGPDETQTNWMKLRPVRSSMEIESSLHDLMNLFFSYIDPLRGIKIAKWFWCRRRASIITVITIDHSRKFSVMASHLEIDNEGPRRL